MHADLIIKNIKELVTFIGSSEPVYGKDMEKPLVIADAAIAVSRGMITEIGNSTELMAKHQADDIIDAHELTALPGFVDCHTHPVFMHTREDEFALRLKGATYVEIAQAGGGIRSTIASTRHASEDDLLQAALPRMQRMISQGTTTIEAKSGYGLSTVSELKQLQVIKKLAQELPLDIVPTFMGAHEYPAEYAHDHQRYLDILCQEMIPAVAEQGIAEFCDIFTEAHVYGLAESRRVLTCAQEHGLKLKMHADEIEPMGGAELAAELSCISADHLGKTSSKGIAALRQAGVIPVLLPATLFSLRSTSYAQGLLMQESSLPVALATDYNPGSCNCDSLPFTMTLACLQMGLSPAAALCASTLNAAFAIGRGQQVGSLEPGKQADITLWDIPGLNFIPYHFGSSHLVRSIKKGLTIFSPGYA